MAPSRIGIYTLGHSGLVVDPNFLEPLLTDDSLQFAQNATHDPLAGHGGGLRKRPGLRQFNATSLGAAILGGIQMPVAGTGGAPAPSGSNSIDDPSDSSGTGGTGSSVGSGSGTGAPGATTDGGVAQTTGSAGASGFGGGAGGVGTVFSGRRLIIIGRDDGTNGNQLGEGWYKTTALYGTDTPVSLTSPGPPTIPANPGLAPPAGASGDGGPGLLGDNMGLLFGGWFYFAQVKALTGDNRITILRTNGVTTQTVCTIPRNPSSLAWQDPDGTDTTEIQNVMSFHGGSNGLLYIVVQDKYNNIGQDDPGKVGSVYAYDPNSQALTVIVQPASPATDRLINQVQLFTLNVGGALGSAGPYLFVAEFVGAIDTPATISAWLPNGFKQNGLGVSDYAGISSQDAFTCMTQYNGRLWAGTRTNSATPVLPSLLTRDPNQPIGSSSAWTVYAGATVGLPSITNSNYSSYTSMAVFGTTPPILYAAYYNEHTSTSYIFSVTPANYGALNTTYTFTQVFSAVTPPIILHVDNGILFAIATGGFGATNKIYSAPDGVTWDGGTSLPNFSNSSYPLSGLFFGLNQT